ncbi:hypothetical protein EAE99_007841 [Botrytis elliptica]|nr:hypothetical protein EAE99_007841 [Botrytis elliptica]
MVYSDSSQNEGLSELLGETLKELRNISSELGEQRKAIQATTKTQFQPSSHAVELSRDTDTPKRRPSRSPSTVAMESAHNFDAYRSNASKFWGDIKDDLYFGQRRGLYLESGSHIRDGWENSSALTLSPSPSSESGITTCPVIDNALDCSVLPSFEKSSPSSRLKNAPQTSATQSSANNSASLTFDGQSSRDPTASALDSNSRYSRGPSRDDRIWNWFEKLPDDHRLDLNSFRGFLSTESRFEKCNFLFEVRDLIHQGCYFLHNISFGRHDDFKYEQPRISAFASGIDPGGLNFDKGFSKTVSGVPTGPVAKIYAQRKAAQLKIQRNGWADEQWRRIILMKGISDMYESIEDLDSWLNAQDLVAFRFTNTNEFENYSRGYQKRPKVRDPKIRFKSAQSMLQDAWRSHGHCRRFGKSDYRSSGATFQITFYEMIPANKGHCGIWKRGKFRNDKVRNWERVIHGVENNDLALRRSCITIVGIIDSFQEWSPENWTVLLLTPIRTNIDTDLYEDGKQAADREFLVAFSGIIDCSTRVVVHHWEVLANYFEKLLSESDTLLEPELHDLLLVDDSKYSKSKKYFWALNMLKEIESDVAAVISQIEGFMDFSKHSPLKKQFPLPEGKISLERERIVKNNLSVVKEDLIRLKSRFNDQRELAKDLRDGLFNASAVMESRASTRLGENVRLLTFVSIFFLPLSFTMSIWSINDSALAHIDIMIGVAVVLGIITYFVVFNVDNIVFLSSQFIKKLEAGTIEHMKNNDNDVWKQRGEGLTEPALANEQNATPSSWRIPQYVWLLALDWITSIMRHIRYHMRKFFKRLTKKKVEQTEQSV